MSVLFACRLLLWPMPTTTASPSPSPSSSFFFLSGCDLCAYICYNIAAPSPSHTHTHTHSRYTTPTRSQPHRAGALYMPWAISVAYFYGRTFCQHSTREREREGERTRSLGVFLFCCCVTRGNNWILLGVFIYLFIFRRFLWFEHFSDFAISPLSPPPVAPLFMHLILPFHSISPHTQRSLIFICTNIFLACSSFLLFLFPAVSLLCYVVFCCFFFASAWFYCPIRFVKHFTFVAHMNFKFLKMFQSFRSLLLCRCVCVWVPPACVCVSVCGGRRQAQAKAGGERRNANCEKIAMCAAPLPLSSPSHYPLPLTLIEMIFNGLKRQRTWINLFFSALSIYTICILYWRLSEIGLGSSNSSSRYKF